MNIFKSDSDSLPLHFGSNVKEKRFKGFPSIDKFFAMTILSGLFAFFIIYLGIYHCRVYSETFSIHCTKSACHYHSYTNFKTFDLDIPKADLREAESIRIDQSGNMIQDSTDPLDGYNVRFKIVDSQRTIGVKDVTTYKYQQFSHKDLTKKTAQRAASQFKRYLQKKSNRAQLTDGNSVTLIGVLSMLAGVILLVVTALYGHFSVMVPKKLKKMK